VLNLKKEKKKRELRTFDGELCKIGTRVDKTAALIAQRGATIGDARNEKRKV